MPVRDSLIPLSSQASGGRDAVDVYGEEPAARGRAALRDREAAGRHQAHPEELRGGRQRQPQAQQGGGFQLSSTMSEVQR